MRPRRAPSLRGWARRPAPEQRSEPRCPTPYPGKGSRAAPQLHSPPGAPPNLQHWPDRWLARRSSGTSVEGRGGGAEPPWLASARIKPQNAAHPPEPRSQGKGEEVGREWEASDGRWEKTVAASRSGPGGSPRQLQDLQDPRLSAALLCTPGPTGGRAPVRLRAASTPPCPRGTFAHLLHLTLPAVLCRMRTRPRSSPRPSTFLLPTSVYFFSLREGKSPSPSETCVNSDLLSLPQRRP